MRLYCKEKLDKRSKRQFLISYFSHKNPATYDLETQEEQCDSRKNRSIFDLKALLDGTFGDENEINDVIQLMVELHKSKYKIRSLFCRNINKVVFNHNNLHRHSGYPDFIITPGHYYCNETIVGADGYSWIDFQNIYKQNQL